MIQSKIRENQKLQQKMQNLSEFFTGEETKALYTKQKTINQLKRCEKVWLNKSE